MTQNSLHWLLIAVLVLAVVTLATSTEGAEIVDCGESRCVQLPMTDAAALIARLHLAEERARLCAEGLHNCEESASEAVERAYEVWSPEFIPAPQNACAWEWYEWLAPLLGGIGVGILVGLAL